MFVPLAGFLGAGKTTTMIAAARALEGSDGRRVSVVTNDQGTELVDTTLARSALPLLDLVGEVTGGCFCCRFDDLMDTVTSLIDEQHADTVIAEAVGSCTDLRATVVRPLRALYGSRFTVAPLTTVVDPLRYRALSPSGPSDLAYLYDHQLAEADVLALNKVDIAPAALVAEVSADLAQRYPAATIVPYSALTGEGLDLLLAAWSSRPAADRDVSLDYDRYAAAEAGLAWLNRAYSLSARDGFEPDAWALRLLEALSALCAEAGVVVGHVKLTVSAGPALVKASLTAAGGDPRLDVTSGSGDGGRSGDGGAGGSGGRSGSGGAGGPVLVEQARAVLNARVACPPEDLDTLTSCAVSAASKPDAVTAEPLAGESFQPSYPRPVHRLTASADTAS